MTARGIRCCPRPTTSRSTLLHRGSHASLRSRTRRPLNHRRGRRHLHPIPGFFILPLLFPITFPRATPGNFLRCRRRRRRRCLLPHSSSSCRFHRCHNTRFPRGSIIGSTTARLPRIRRRRFLRLRIRLRVFIGFLPIAIHFHAPKEAASTT